MLCNSGIPDVISFGLTGEPGGTSGLVGSVGSSGTLVLFGAGFVPAGGVGEPPSPPLP